MEEYGDKMQDRDEHLNQLENAIFDALELEVERQEREQTGLNCIEIAKVLIAIAHVHLSFDMPSDEELSEIEDGDARKLN